MNSKKIFISLLVLGVAFSWGALAANDNQRVGNSRADVVREKQAGRKDEKQDKIVENLCNRISGLAEKFNAASSEQENRIRTRQEERAAKWIKKSTQVEDNLASHQEAWDENRDKQFVKLEEQAVTEEQKIAIEKFKATVRTAVSTRRTATSAAMKTFRDGVESAVRTRQGQTDKFVSDSKSARQAAINKAVEACEAGSDPATVRTTLRTSLQTAKGKVQSDKKNIERVSATVEALITTRKQAVEKAKTDFKATMERARVELKKAFPANVE